MNNFKKVSVTALLVLLVVFLATHIWLRGFPQDISKYEDALATNDIQVLGHFKNGESMRIWRLLRGSDDPFPIPAPESQKNFIKDLLFGDMSFETNVEQVVWALHKSEDLPILSFVLVGNLDSETIKSNLKSHGEIQEVSGNSFSFIHKLPPSSDPYACPKDLIEKQKKIKPIFITAEDDWVYATYDNESIDIFTSRINSGETPAYELAKWRSFRSDYLFGFTTFDMKELIDAGGMGLNMLASGLLGDYSEISKISGRFKVGYLQREIEAELQLKSTEQWISDSRSKGESVLAEVESDTFKFSRTLATIISQIAFKEEEKDSLHVIYRGKAPSDILASVNTIIAEIFQSIFSFGGSGSDLKEESIDDNPWDFSYQSNFSKVVDFETDSFHSDKRYYIEGGYALKLSSIKYNEQTNANELEIDILRQISPDESRFHLEGVQGKLLVKSILGEDGQELLMDDRCIDAHHQKNHESASIFAYANNSRLTGERTVNLKVGTSLQDIRSVELQSSLKVAASVVEKRVPAKEKSFIEHEGLRIYINKIEGSSVTYTLSGEEERLVAVRGLNSEGKTLRRMSSSTGRSRRTLTVRGEPSEIQFFIAEKYDLEEKTFRFSLDNNFWDFSPGFGGPSPDIDLLTLKDIKQIPDFNVSDLTTDGNYWYENPKNRVASQVSGPFRFELLDELDDWSSPKLRISYPNLKKFKEYRGSMEVEIYEPVPETGSNNPFTIDLKHAGLGSLHDIFVGDYEYHFMTPKLPVSFSKEEPPRMLKGIARLYIPKEVKVHKSSLPGIGESLTFGDDSKIEVKSQDRTGIELKFLSESDRLIQFFLETENQQWVRPYDNNGFDEFELRIGNLNKVTDIKIFYANDFHILEYPFELEPDYSSQQ